MAKNNKSSAYAKIKNIFGLLHLKKMFYIYVQSGKNQLGYRMIESNFIVFQ